ncbi:MAG TPA: hypothetical protein VFV78_12290 [Vicinamibacterales bacterium]|nr:hypothetical protein [Vicinamibacterales bacterium]
MGENTNQIEQEIRERRSDLGRNLTELEDKARELADWRTYYRDHPRVFLGAAIGAGIVLALSTVPRKKAASPAFDFDDAEAMPGRDTSHDVYRLNGSERHEAPRRQRSETVQKIRREVGDTWEQIATGLLHLASAKAVELVSNHVPGFRDYVEERHRPAGRTLH